MGLLSEFHSLHGSSYSGVQAKSVGHRRHIKPFPGGQEELIRTLFTFTLKLPLKISYYIFYVLCYIILFYVSFMST